MPKLDQPEKTITMGERLAAYFDPEYYAMGFDFFKGSMLSQYGPATTPVHDWN